MHPGLLYSASFLEELVDHGHTTNDDRSMVSFCRHPEEAIRIGRQPYRVLRSVNHSEGDATLRLHAPLPEALLTEFALRFLDLLQHPDGVVQASWLAPGSQEDGFHSPLCLQCQPGGLALPRD